MQRTRAFTLIELLTVIAIVGVLAGILVATIGGVRKKAHQTRCVANLRQVGIALLSKVNDNRGVLPGPLYLQVLNRYGYNETTALGAHLAPYLGLPEHSTLGAGVRVAIPQLHCPSRPLPSGEADDNTIGTYALQCTLNNAKTSNASRYPFGEVTNNRAPIRYLELDQFGGPSRVWALVEVDQQVTYSPIRNTTSWHNAMPAAPSHGANRTFLYFDASVQLRSDLPPSYN